MGIPHFADRECVEATEWCERAVVFEGEAAKAFGQCIRPTGRGRGPSVDQIGVLGS